MALVRALSAVDAGSRASTLEVRRQIGSMGERSSPPSTPTTRDDIISVIGHVWYSTLTSWAISRTDFDVVTSELTRAVHVLVDPYEERSAAEPVQ